MDETSNGVNFVCPHCGGHDLECTITEKQYCTVEFEDDGWPYAGDMFGGDYVGQTEYRCSDCFREFTQHELRDIFLSCNKK